MKEYTFYDDGYTTIVDRTNKIVTMDERGGWSRTYRLTFAQLLEYASQWDIEVSLSGPDEKIAEVATNIMLANNAVKHGLDPYSYVPYAC